MLDQGAEINLVYSDQMPVAWATVHAGVVTPSVPMSPAQAKHQRQAAGVLTDLDRDILEELADQRDQREGRPDMSQAHGEASMLGALRVAPVHDPTATRWVPASADLDQTRDTIARTLGVPAADAMIVNAVGYGHHGYQAHRLSLDLICAMQATAAANNVSLATVGAWIDHDHGQAGHVDPTTLPGRFAAAYIGQYACDTAYTRHVMDTHGWTDLLRTTGMEPYFDLRRYERHLFTSDVFAIDLDGWNPGRQIEVFHRRPATS